jgi:hypothetical protein
MTDAAPGGLLEREQVEIQRLSTDDGIANYSEGAEPVTDIDRNPSVGSFGV